MYCVWDAHTTILKTSALSMQWSTLDSCILVLVLYIDVWSAPGTTGEKPPAMARHTFTKIDHHRAVAFGGSLGGGKNNDAYILDMETWVWSLLVIGIAMCMWILFEQHMSGTRWPLGS